MPRSAELRINPAVLTWARESMGYSVEEAARKVNVDAARLLAWETGRAFPTYIQLESLAYRVYKRPLAVLFRKEPPTEPTPGEDFRNLPGTLASRLSTETRLAIRRTKHLQNLLRELGEEIVPPLMQFTLTLQENPEAAAGRFREFVGLRLDEQEQWPNDKAFEFFRNLVETQGVCVFLVEMPLEEARAFALGDPVVPVIAINRQDPETARAFSLFHEVAHILLRVNGIFLSNPPQEGRSPQQRIESYCDRFAAAFLLPDEAFRGDIAAMKIRKGDVSDVTVAQLARQYKVSREAVYRKLTDLGFVPTPVYFSRRQEWNQEAIAAREERRRKAKEQGGGPVAPDLRTVKEKGKGYINRVMDGYEQGKIGYGDLSNYLEIKLEYLPNLLDRLR